MSSKQTADIVMTCEHALLQRRRVVTRSKYFEDLHRTLEHVVRDHEDSLIIRGIRKVSESVNLLGRIDKRLDELEKHSLPSTLPATLKPKDLDAAYAIVRSEDEYVDMTVDVETKRREISELLNQNLWILKMTQKIIEGNLVKSMRMSIDEGVQRIERWIAEHNL